MTLSYVSTYATLLHWYNDVLTNQRQWKIKHSSTNLGLSSHRGNVQVSRMLLRTVFPSTSYCSKWLVLSLHYCFSKLLCLSVTICWSGCTFPVKNQKSWKKGKIDKGTSSAGLGRVVSWPLCHVASVYPHLKFHQNYILFILCSKKGVGNFSTLKVVFNFSARNWDHYCSYLKLITY